MSGLSSKAGHFIHSDQVQVAVAAWTLLIRLEGTNGIRRVAFGEAGLAVVVVSLGGNRMSNRYEVADVGVEGLDVRWGTLQYGVTEADMISLADKANADGFLYLPYQGYGAVLAEPLPVGVDLRGSRDSSLHLYVRSSVLTDRRSATVSSDPYELMDFGYNGCDVHWGTLQKGVSLDDMVAMASAADADGFTYQPKLQYGAVLVGSFPKGCHSDPHLSWPLYLKKS